MRSESPLLSVCGECISYIFVLLMPLTVAVAELRPGMRVRAKFKASSLQSAALCKWYAGTITAMYVDLDADEVCMPLRFEPQTSRQYRLVCGRTRRLKRSWKHTQQQIALPHRPRRSLTICWITVRQMRYDVDYDDGDKEKGVKPQFVRLAHRAAGANVAVAASKLASTSMPDVGMPGVSASKLASTSMPDVGMPGVSGRDKPGPAKRSPQGDESSLQPSSTSPPLSSPPLPVSGKQVLQDAKRVNVKVEEQARDRPTKMGGVEQQQAEDKHVKVEIGEAAVKNEGKGESREGPAEEHAQRKRVKVEETQEVPQPNGRDVTRVGRRLRIHFFLDDPPKWYAGRIVKVNNKGLHFIRFDNGDTAWYDIAKEEEGGWLRWGDAEDEEGFKEEGAGGGGEGLALMDRERERRPEVKPEPSLPPASATLPLRPSNAASLPAAADVSGGHTEHAASSKRFKCGACGGMKRAAACRCGNPCSQPKLVSSL